MAKFPDLDFGGFKWKLLASLFQVRVGLDTTLWGILRGLICKWGSFFWFLHGFSTIWVWCPSFRMFSLYFLIKSMSAHKLRNSKNKRHQTVIVGRWGDYLMQTVLLVQLSKNYPKIWQIYTYAYQQSPKQSWWIFMLVKAISFKNRSMAFHGIRTRVSTFLRETLKWLQFSDE